MKKTFVINYWLKRKPSLTTHSETWEYRDDLFCPFCGEETVWEADDEDYYVGTQFICTACEAFFHLPFSGNRTLDKQDQQRLEELRKETKG